MNKKTIVSPRELWTLSEISEAKQNEKKHSKQAGMGLLSGVEGDVQKRQNNIHN
jgi:hypothetical protein